MPRLNYREQCRWLFLGTAVALGSLNALGQSQRTWVGGDADWIDNAASHRWSPQDEPDPDDLAAFNSANRVRLGSDNEVHGLNLLAAVRLDLAGYDLRVNDRTWVRGSVGAEIFPSTLFVAPGSLFSSQHLDVDLGGVLDLSGEAVFAGSTSVLGTVRMNDTGLGVPVVRAGAALHFVDGGKLETFGNSAVINSALTLDEGAVAELFDGGSLLDVNGVLNLSGGDIREVTGGATLASRIIEVRGVSAVNVTNFDYGTGSVIATSIHAGGDLHLDVTHLGPDAANNDVYRGNLRFLGGKARIEVGDGTWIHDGTISALSGGQLFGDRIEIGDDNTPDSARIRVIGGTFSPGSRNSVQMPGTEVIRPPRCPSPLPA